MIQTHRLVVVQCFRLNLRVEQIHVSRPLQLNFNVVLPKWEKSDNQQITVHDCILCYYYYC